jgi:amino acid transporter
MHGYYGRGIDHQTLRSTIIHWSGIDLFAVVFSTRSHFSSFVMHHCCLIITYLIAVAIGITVTVLFYIGFSRHCRSVSDNGGEIKRKSKYLQR